MTSMSNAQEHWTAAGITSVMWPESVKLVSDLSDSTSSSSTCGNLFVLDHFWVLIKMVASWWWHCYFLNVYVYQYSWYLLFPPQHNLEVNLNIFIAFKLRHQSAELFVRDLHHWRSCDRRCLPVWLILWQDNSESYQWTLMEFLRKCCQWKMNILIEFWRDFDLWASKVLLFRVETQPTKSDLGQFCVSRIPRNQLSFLSWQSDCVNLSTDRLGEACC